MVKHVSVNFTIRLPKEVLEAMRKYKQVNWSQVIRDSIISYLKKLREMERVELSKSLINRLIEKGVNPNDLKPLSYRDEVKLYKRMVEREWKPQVFYQPYP